MKIDPHDPASARPVSGSRRPARGEEPAQAQSKGSAASDGAPGLSDRVRLAQAATAAIADMQKARERLKRLDELQAAIDHGQYGVPADDLVTRLWQSGAMRW